MTDSVELFPIAIGEYDSAEWDRIDGIDANLAMFLDAFDGFVCHVVEWRRTAPPCCGKSPADRQYSCSSCPERKSDHYRGHDDINARLREWSEGDPAARSILYWVGHGWSDDDQAALIHSRTSPEHPGTEGIRPEQIAEAIRSRFVVSPRPWVVVMVEACQAARFVVLLQNELNRLGYNGIYLLVSPTSDNGAVMLGRLQTMLRTAFAAEDVLLDRLAKALDRAGLLVKQSGPIPDDVVALERRIRLPANISLDAREQLATAVGRLPPDVQRHFITKAHGGLGSFERVVLNEQSWFFEGRESDTQQVISWLRDNSSGMLVITGPPGSGKSAFLGNMIVHANAPLREALRHAGLLTAPPEGLPENIFDVCLTLTGAPSEEVVARLAATIDARIPDDTAGGEIAEVGKWLAREMRSRGEPITIVLDALDEAAFPEELADYVLRPLGRVPAVRLLIGTRQSTYDQIDTPTTDKNLLHALGVSETDTVTIRSDRRAIRKFVAHRVASRIQQDPSIQLDVDRFADAVAQRDPHFLMAQLAVHEVLGNPALHSEHAWSALLDSSHQSIFERAVTRLYNKEPSYRAVLVGLAFSSGLGLPIHDEVWRTVAQAIEDLEPYGRRPVTDEHIESFLDDAAPYVTVDKEYDQTVYRFSHRTFAEHFTGNSERAAIRELWIARALISASDEELKSNGEDKPFAAVNPYIRHYLPTHVANAGQEGWDLLADNKLLVALLNPDQIGANAQRSAFGRFALPPIIEGIANAHNRLNRVDPGDYRFAVGLAAARVTGHHVVTGVAADAEVIIELCWAAVKRRMHCRSLPSHADSVHAFATIPSPGENFWLAGAGRKGAILIWDPVSGRLVKKLPGHTGAVTALAVLTHPTMGPVLVSTGHDSKIRFWDVARGDEITMFTGHPPITAMVAIQSAYGQHLLVCASSATIAVLDATDGRIVGKYFEHSGEITALAVVPDPSHYNLLASAAKDGTLRLWDPGTGHTFGSLETSALSALTTVPLPKRAAPMLAGATSDRILLWDYTNWGHPDISHKQPERVLSSSSNTITALATLALPGRQPRVAGAGPGAISVWDLNLTQRHPVTHFASLGADTRSITALTAVPLADGGSLLASANYDTIRLWNPVAGQPHATVNHRIDNFVSNGPVTAMATFRPAESKTLLATAGNGSIALWNSENGDRLHLSASPADHRGRVTALAEISATDGRSMLAGGTDTGAIRLWGPGIAQGRALTASGNSQVTALTEVRPLDKPPMLASGDSDGVVRLWDLTTGQRPPIATVSNNCPITALASIPTASGGALLAIADHQGSIRLFDSADLAARQPATTLPTDSVAETLAVTTSDAGVPLLAAAGSDGTIRLFDTVDPADIRPFAALSGHKGAVTALATWPGDGRPSVLVSGGRDNSIRLWNPSLTTALHVIPVDATVKAVVPLPDARLAVALDDGLLVLRIDMKKVLHGQRLSTISR
ncbi:hypothetical protein [Nocardia beijingensis]|uniref:hypothetical protein n=1 Tax=Nocardia beijingensis TaxID=95162 RepID=UPI0018961BEA|nr:hypothetical protein [Nocardia beijingensis]MBF6079485.1 hypothetical protein [Nocardia beijingensis]